MNTDDGAHICLHASPEWRNERFRGVAVSRTMTRDAAHDAGKTECYTRKTGPYHEARGHA